MVTSVKITFTPGDLSNVAKGDLSRTTCVVFDVLRFTSTIVTALVNGATTIIPASSIPHALELRSKYPDALLGGERNGRRITAQLSGGTEFDLGNSPREYTPERIKGKKIISTTTNGSFAIHSCATASKVYIASLLNLSAISNQLLHDKPQNLLLVCSGTEEEPATEDVYAAGLLWEQIQSGLKFAHISDGVRIAHLLAQRVGNNPLDVIPHSRNAQRLLSIEDLKEDVPFCLRLDVFDIVPKLQNGALVA